MITLTFKQSACSGGLGARPQGAPAGTLRYRHWPLRCLLKPRLGHRPATRSASGHRRQASRASSRSAYTTFATIRKRQRFDASLVDYSGWATFTGHYRGRVF